MQNVFLQNLNNALGFYQRKNFSAAISLLLPLTKQQPGNGQVWHLLALSYKNAGDNDNSEQSFVKALSLAPTDINVLNDFATFQLQAGKVTKAIETLKQALKVNPKHTSSRYNLGLGYFRLKNYAEAEKALTPLITAQQLTAKSVGLIINVWNHLGKSDKSIGLLEPLSQAQSFPSHLARLLAESYEHSQQFEQALRVYLSLVNTSEFAPERIANCYYSAGMADQAKQFLLANIAAGTKPLELMKTYAKICAKVSDDAWLTLYEQAISKQPDNMQLIVDFGYLLFKSGQTDKAHVLLSEYYRAETASAAYTILLSHVKREAGLVDEASALIQGYDNPTGRSQDYLLQLFTDALVNKDYEQALTLMAGMLEEQPLHQGWWAHYAAALKFAGRGEEYRALYDFDSTVNRIALDVPQGFDTIEQFNAQLMKTLDERHGSASHPLDQSLRFGTQTEGNLFAWQHPVIVSLQTAIMNAVHRYVAALPENKTHPFLSRKQNALKYSGSWSVRLRQGGYHHNHYHSEGWLSGCYYIHLPDILTTQGQGWLKLGQAEISAALPNEPDYIVRPAEGHLILFPSMMWHGTVPFSSNELRYTVAFDIVPDIENGG